MSIGSGVIGKWMASGLLSVSNGGDAKQQLAAPCSLTDMVSGGLHTVASQRIKHDRLRGNNWNRSKLRGDWDKSGYVL